MAIENRIGAIWLGKQTAKGTPAVDGDLKQGRWTSGDINMQRADGSSQYLDGERFSNAADFVDTIVGNGTPGFHAQPGWFGYLAYLFLGQESVSAINTITGTGVESVHEHVATPGSGGAFWLTAKKKVGQSVGPLRQRFTDYRPSALRIEGSSAAKTLICSLPGTAVGEVGNTYTTDPAAGLESGEPLKYTEAAGRISIDIGDGTLAVFRGASSLACQLNDSVNPWYGDDVTPYDVIFGLGNIVLEGLTVLVDAAGLELFNYIMYGTKNPPTGTPPRVILPPFGAYEYDARRGSHYTATITGTPTGGGFTLTYRGQTTASIDFDATATEVQTALEGLVNLEPGDVAVAGGPGPATPYEIQLKQDVVLPANFTAANTFTGGTAPAITLTDKGAVKQIKLELPNVKWNPDVAIPASPEGGATELSLGAEARRVAPDPHVRITTRSSEVAFT